MKSHLDIELDEKMKQAKTHALRSYLPYGKWTCADGREVLFNRAYKPIWQRHNGKVEIADAREWVEHVKEEWFFDDVTAPWPGYSVTGSRTTLRKCVQILDEWGVFGVNAEHHLIGPEPRQRRTELAVIPGGIVTEPEAA